MGGDFNKNFFLKKKVEKHGKKTKLTKLKNKKRNLNINQKKKKKKGEKKQHNNQILTGRRCCGIEASGLNCFR